MHDDGTLQILRATVTSEAGRKPVSSYTVIHQACYEERTVGSTRYYNAQQANMQVDMLFRIPRVYGLKTGDMVTLNPYACAAPTTLFQIQQVQQVYDDDNLPATDISVQQMQASAPVIPEE